MNYDIAPILEEEISSNLSMCEKLDNIWKIRKLGEFRKAHFAKYASNCINDNTWITQEINTIIDIIEGL